MPQIAAEVYAAGGFFIIAHPVSVGDPICTGCDWRYDDSLPAERATISAQWQGCNASDQVRLIANGTVVFEHPANERGQQQWDFAPEEAGWYVLELREANGRLRAVTNPIFVGGPEQAA